MSVIFLFSFLFCLSDIYVCCDVFSAFLKECVKRRALLSVKVNPHCSEKAAEAAVEKVWDMCYNDPRPFDKAL